MAKTKKTHLLEIKSEQDTLDIQSENNQVETIDNENNVFTSPEIQDKQESFILIQDMGNPFGKKGDIVTYDHKFKDIKKTDFDELIKESIRLNYIKIYE